MTPREQIAAILSFWLGRFDNGRQVAATLARGGPPPLLPIAARRAGDPPHLHR
jgi:hypothetical protein